MVLTARQVLLHARDLHPALSEQNAPIPLGLRAISRMQRDLVAAIAVRVPALIAQVTAVALPLADFDAGIDLETLITTDWADLLQLEFTSATAPAVTRPPITGEFVPWEQRGSPRKLPAFTFRGNVLYLLGQANDYTPYSEVKLSYTPVPADVTDDTTELLLDTKAREALAWDVAGFWLMRLVGMPQLQITADIAGAFNSRAVDERKQFLSNTFRLTQRQSYHVKVVY